MGLNSDSQNRPPTAQTAEGSPVDGKWLRRAMDAFNSSTSYVDSNFRKQWDDSIRAFHNQHPSDSKYSQPAYEKRSRLYRPKTRAVIRKNEAAAAAAFFSNMDIISIEAEDQSSKAQVISAEVMKSLLQYRLRKSIPWFQFVMGGIQDAQVTGTVCAHVRWDYRVREQEEAEPVEEQGEDGGDEENPTQKNLPRGAFTLGGEPEEPVEPVAPQEPVRPKPYIDKPCLDLIPVENLRIDPSASWIDPINSSPYVIHMIPMYVMDVKDKIDSGEWLPVTDAQLASSVDFGIDSTRIARQKDRDDPQSSDTRAYSEIDIVWVHRHIHRDRDQDWEFYVLGNVTMLTPARKLEQVEFHGKRPYVCGTFILETHKVFSSGVPQLGKGLQDEANEISNQRIDNVKFALNKKWFAKRGKDVDVNALVRNVAGGVIMMDDPTNDVREISTPDVTQSSYEEQNRINLDMDELLGNFNPAALIANGGGQAPARNMALLNQNTGTLVEYGIRTFVETFLQPVLRLMILLEQEYETDEVVLSLAAKNAKLFQKFGVDQVTDNMLMQELTLNVSVGMGATDPSQKLQKFLTGMTSYTNILKNAPPGMNSVEVGKEIFAHLGYNEPSRFFTTDNPQVVQLQDQLQKAMAMIQELQKKAKEKTDQMLAGIAKTKDTNETKKEVAHIQESAANTRALATHYTALMKGHNDRNAPKGSGNGGVRKAG